MLALPQFPDAAADANSTPSPFPLTTSLPESQTEIHLNCKPTTIRPLQAVHHAPCAMCHVTCLPRLWETIAFSHRYLSYRLRELRCTGLNCTELNLTELSWAPPWRTILYKYLRLAPLPPTPLLDLLPRPAHSFKECHCECHTNCSLCAPSCLLLPCPVLLCPACLPSFVSALPGHNVSCVCIVYDVRYIYMSSKTSAKSGHK